MVLFGGEGCAVLGVRCGGRNTGGMAGGEAVDEDVSTGKENQL